MVERSAASTIDSFGSTFNLPFISIGEPLTFHPYSLYAVFLKPSYLLAILDLTQHYQWNKISYLYDTDEGNNTTSTLRYSAMQNDV